MIPVSGREQLVASGALKDQVLGHTITPAHLGKVKLMPVNYNDHVQSRVKDTAARLTEVSQHIAVARDRKEHLERSQIETMAALEKEFQERKAAAEARHTENMNSMEEALAEYENLYIKLSEELADYTNQLSVNSGFKSFAERPKAVPDRKD